MEEEEEGRGSTSPTGLEATTTDQPPRPVGAPALSRRECCALGASQHNKGPHLQPGLSSPPWSMSYDARYSGVSVCAQGTIVVTNRRHNDPSLPLPLPPRAPYRLLRLRADTKKG